MHKKIQKFIFGLPSRRKRKGRRKGLRGLWYNGTVQQQENAGGSEDFGAFPSAFFKLGSAEQEERSGQRRTGEGWEGWEGW